MQIDIKHDRERQRFVAQLDGKEANLQYSQTDEKTLDYESTFVPVEFRKQGVGERLVMEALGFARDNGYEVIPTCPFVRHVLEEHSEYDDVVARK
ncbi:MAG: GNAT family N-acetyltransferase [Gemmatimonadota bacterium]